MAESKSVWIQVYDEDFEAIGDVFKIKPLPDDVSDLRKEIKKENSNTLSYCDAHQLSIYPALDDAKEPNISPYKAGKKITEIIADNSDDNPFVAIAPKKPDNKAKDALVKLEVTSLHDDTLSKFLDGRKSQIEIALVGKNAKVNHLRHAFTHLWGPSGSGKSTEALLRTSGTRGALYFPLLSGFSKCQEIYKGAGDASKALYEAYAIDKANGLWGAGRKKTDNVEAKPDVNPGSRKCMVMGLITAMFKQGGSIVDNKWNGISITCVCPVSADDLLPDGIGDVTIHLDEFPVEQDEHSIMSRLLRDWMTELGFNVTVLGTTTRASNLFKQFITNRQSRNEEQFWSNVYRLSSVENPWTPSSDIDTVSSLLHHTNALVGELYNNSRQSDIVARLNEVLQALINKKPSLNDHLDVTYTMMMLNKAFTAVKFMEESKQETLVKLLQEDVDLVDKAFAVPAAPEFSLAPNKENGDLCKLVVVVQQDGDLTHKEVDVDWKKCLFDRDDTLFSLILGTPAFDAPMQKLFSDLIKHVGKIVDNSEAPVNTGMYREAQNTACLITASRRGGLSTKRKSFAELTAQLAYELEIVAKNKISALQNSIDQKLRGFNVSCLGFGFMSSPNVAWNRVHLKDISHLQLDDVFRTSSGVSYDIGVRCFPAGESKFLDTSRVSVHNDIAEEEGTEEPHAADLIVESKDWSESNKFNANDAKEMLEKMQLYPARLRILISSTLTDFSESSALVNMCRENNIRLLVIRDGVVQSKSKHDMGSKRRRKKLNDPSVMIVMVPALI